MTHAGCAGFCSVPPQQARLAAGLAVSAVLHLALVLSFTPAAPRSAAPAAPLQVELRREAAPETAAEIAAEQPADAPPTAPPAAVPEEQPRQEPQPHAAVPDKPVGLEVPFDKYFTARELDIRAEQINDVDLVYPQRAYAMRTRGRVVLRLYINERGAIDHIAVLDAAPPGVFEESALTAARALQFKPAVKMGRDVKSQKTIEVVFDPYESIRIP